MADLQTKPTRAAYGVLGGLALLLIGMGFFLNPDLPSIAGSLIATFPQPSTLDFDTMQHAGIGAGLVNCGLMLLIALGVYRATKTEIQGVHLAAAAMILGFAVYGKNLVNIWWPMSGVFLYAMLTKKTFASVSALAVFGTALSPVFSVLAFGTEALAHQRTIGLLLGVLFATFGGLLTGLFADVLPRLHGGYVLYNGGFAAGVAGFIINSILGLLKLGHAKYPYVEVATAVAEGIPADYLYGQNQTVGLILVVLFGYLIVCGILLKGLASYPKLIWHKSKGGNYVQEFGMGAALVNMGIVGLIAAGYVLLTFGGQYCGPVFACIWTAAGFAANGVTPRMQLPLMAGVYASAYLSGGIDKLSSRGMILAAIFSAGASPVIGDLGLFAGLAIAVAHTFLVPNTGILHGWMSLYNNGFSLGILASFVGATGLYLREQRTKS